MELSHVSRLLLDALISLSLYYFLFFFFFFFIIILDFLLFLIVPFPFPLPSSFHFLNFFFFFSSRVIVFSHKTSGTLLQSRRRRGHSKTSLPPALKWRPLYSNIYVHTHTHTHTLFLSSFQSPFITAPPLSLVYINSIRMLTETKGACKLRNSSTYSFVSKRAANYPFTDEAQTALFKDPVRTAL